MNRLKRRFSFPCFFALLALALLLGPAASGSLAAQSKGRQAAQATLTQVGVIDALLAGGYAGSMPIGRLRRAGDLGLGTFDHLDGEMVLLDGVVYQVPVDGVVRRPADSVTTPFAQACSTRGARSLAVAAPAGAGLHEVEAALDAALGDLNRFAAVRLDGDFRAVQTRSVPRQEPPYRPLAEVAKEQRLFDFAEVRGTLVGLRGPAFAKGLGVPGWHWHFLTADRTRGGHVLSFSLARGAQARLTPVSRLVLVLPGQGLQGLDLARDRAAELKSVETAPAGFSQGAQGAQGTAR